jgi:ActR/RegA family two-component response regulator
MASDGATTRRRRLLLLEDNAVLARAIGSAVEECGEVTTTGTAREALACLDRRWHAFVFDICLPDGSGLDVLRQARMAQPDAVALVISGDLRPADVNTACGLGAHYLAKPFRADAIVGFLERAFSNARFTRDETGPASPGGCEVPMLDGSEVGRLLEEVRWSAASAEAAGSEHTYRLALLARAATAGSSSMGLEACAKAAEVSRQTLHDYVTLTTRWEPAHVANLIGSGDRSGRTISKQHLLRIARGPAVVRRAFDQAVERGDLDLDAVLSALSTRG